MDITKESAGVDASSVGVQISVGISSLGPCRNSHGFRISWTGQRHIITGRAGTISHLQGISSLSTGMQMKPEIMLVLWNDVMEKQYIPLRATEAMQLGEAPTELGVE